jgi:uncharacterized protein (TIGR02284 family)
MNRLIVACRDDAHASGETASSVMEPGHRKRLLEQARRCRGFAEMLGREVSSLGGTPAKHGSMLAALGASVRSVRSAIGGLHEGDAYADSMRMALRTVKAYTRATSTDLPPRARLVVEAQAREVAEWCAELTRLRGCH